MALLTAYFAGSQPLQVYISKFGPKFDNLHPMVKIKAIQIINEMNAWLVSIGHPYRVGLHDGWRTEARQKGIIASPKRITFVRDWRSSYHVWGLAIDIVFIPRIGRWLWPDYKTQKGKRLWDKLGSIVEKYGMEWGGRWKNFDGPHAQLVSLGRTSSLKKRYSRNPLAFVEQNITAVV